MVKGKVYLVLGKFFLVSFSGSDNVIFLCRDVFHSPTNLLDSRKPCPWFNDGF